jgi:nucleotide-binding universal stress UspA family protein
MSTTEIGVMRILLAVDDSPFSQAAVAAVKSQFHREDTEVCVFTSVNWDENPPLSLGFAEGAGYAGDLLAIRDKAFDAAKNLAGQTTQTLQSSGFHCNSQIKTGDPRRRILEYAEEWKPDVIVLGSHGRSGFERFLLGSVAEGVARHAKCSVYIVRKPE